jgi:hypothetical protein
LETRKSRKPIVILVHEHFDAIDSLVAIVYCTTSKSIAFMMRTGEILTVLALVTSQYALGFVPTTNSNSRILTLQQASSSDSSGEQQPDPVEAFMENASAKGADKVREMSVEERTRRAMLAEAVEDRIFSMYDDLEGLLQDGVPANDEDRDEIQSLAREIKASQSQYENLVSGEASAILGTIGNIGSNSTESKRNQKEGDAAL